MLSSSARDGFDLLLMQALKGSLIPSDEQAEVSIVNADDFNGMRDYQMVVLTISSYLFRAMVMFHFVSDKPTREHFARLSCLPEPEMSEQAFIDAIAERGNLCCGILNRELGNFFAHIGMSTPNVIDQQCAAYLSTLRHQHVQHFAVQLTQSQRLFVTLCVSAYDEIDFQVDPAATAAETGELELF